MPDTPYSYRSSVKSDASDELINTFIIRPAAGVIVRLLYRTPVSPNQVTLASIAAGLLAAFFFTRGTSRWTALGGLLVTCKDLLDSADGQLARAKGAYSRMGRFLDSIGDIIVNAALFAGMSVGLARGMVGPTPFVLGIIGFLGISLRVSYHVYYQTSSLHLSGSYTVNRLTEKLREEDRKEAPLTQRLQQSFQILYGWQDVLMSIIDRWSLHRLPRTDHHDALWYGDRLALRFSGFLGLGTELALLTVCALTNSLETYLYINIFFLNTIWALCILYRRVVLSHLVHPTLR